MNHQIVLQAMLSIDLVAPGWLAWFHSVMSAEAARRRGKGRSRAASRRREDRKAVGRVVLAHLECNETRVWRKAGG